MNSTQAIEFYTVRRNRATSQMAQEVYTNIVDVLVASADMIEAKHTIGELRDIAWIPRRKAIYKRTLKELEK